MAMGGNFPENYRELQKQMERRIALLERSMDQKARQREVNVLNKYVDQLLQAGVPGILTTGEDLNDYDSTGMWHQNANADAATGSNYPVDAAGLLEVVESEDFVYQTYMTYRADRRVFYRQRYVGVWSEWQAIGGGGTPWTDLLFNSGYEPYSAAYPCQARNYNGVVHLRGLLKRTSGNFASNTIYNIGRLPFEAMSPEGSLYFPAATSTGLNNVMLVISWNHSSTDQIELRMGTSSAPYIGIAGISFLPEVSI